MPTIRSHGIDIRYEVTGEGPPVVLGHSFLASSDMWAPQVPALAERYQVINIDARGHGASGTASRSFTLYEMVDDVVAVLDAVGVERAIWAGLSVGGMVALRAALEVPSRVGGLVLLDTDAGPEGLGKRLKYAALAAAARRVGVAPVSRQVTRIMFGPTTLRTKAALVEEWRQRFASVDVPSALHALRAISGRDDLLARLQQIAVPALVIVGEEDRALPPSRSRRLTAGLREARLVEIPGAGHLATLEQPERVTEEMLALLDEVYRKERSREARETAPPSKPR